MEDRRSFIKKALAGCAAGGLMIPSGMARIDAPEEEHDHPAHWIEARHYEKIEEMKVKCTLCPRECSVADRERGYCGVRENRAGTYYTLVHSRPCSVHVDPVEKKPLYHFVPGHKSFSVATVGCNIECRFCQNWEISQFTPEQRPSYDLSPAKLAYNAARKGCKSIAYTYTEPVIFYEYMYDCAKEGKKRGVMSAMISNGYIREKPLRELIPVLDGVKIDLKAFTDDFYRDMCSGRLEPVLQTLKILKETGIWFEIVVLLIPSYNDSKKEIQELCAWVRDQLGANVPLHFTRFHPVYKVKDIPVTPESSLKRAYEIAKSKGLNFPYIGNVAGNEGAHTFCPHCGKKVITRFGFHVAKLDMREGNCAFCSKTLPGIWQPFKNEEDN